MSAHHSVNAPSPPAWVTRLFAGKSAVRTAPSVEVVSRPPFFFVRAQRKYAADPSAAEIRSSAAGLYRRIRKVTAANATPHPLRFWNFITRIHEPLGKDLDHYMAFNAGRHDALREWFSEPATFPTSLPTATGVGHPGGGLHVDCLAGRKKGISAENPRQRPAYRYGERYGPSPPCFSRGTLVDIQGTPTLLVGGTASVRGEDSMHAGRIEGQLEETFANLDSLVDSAARWHAVPPGVFLFRELRTYYSRAEDADLIRNAIEGRFPDVGEVEMIHADLCRPELLVEIEGMASIGIGSASSRPY